MWHSSPPESESSSAYPIIIESAVKVASCVPLWLVPLALAPSSSSQLESSPTGSESRASTFEFEGRLEASGVHNGVKIERTRPMPVRAQACGPRLRARAGRRARPGAAALSLHCKQVRALVTS